MLGMNRRTKYRRFHYEPRHFDPQQEELKSRVEMKRLEDGKEVDPNRYRQRISKMYQDSKATKSTDLNRMLRLAVIAGVLVGLMFWYDVPTMVIKFFVR